MGAQRLWVERGLAVSPLPVLNSSSRLPSGSEKDGPPLLSVSLPLCDGSSSRSNILFRDSTVGSRLQPSPFLCCFMSERASECSAPPRSFHWPPTPPSLFRSLIFVPLRIEVDVEKQTFFFSTSIFSPLRLRFFHRVSSCRVLLLRGEVFFDVGASSLRKSLFLFCRTRWWMSWFMSRVRL